MKKIVDSGYIISLLELTGLYLAIVKYVFSTYKKDPEAYNKVNGSFLVT